MAFIDSIDTIREKAAEAAQVAARKTKQLAEIAKSNVSIYAEEDRIKKAQQELGKLFYRDYVVGEEMDEAEYLPWCQQIDEARQNIADLRDYIDELKAERVEIVVEEDPDADEVVDESDFADLDPVTETAEETADDGSEEPQIEVIVCDEPAETSETEE